MVDIDLNELQEDEKQGKDIKGLQRQEFDIEDMTIKTVKFCEAISGIEFYPYQTEYAKGIVRSLLANDGEEITALFSRQSGKSEVNACVVAGCMVILPILAKLFPWYEPLQNYKNGLYVGIFAPSGDQANTTFGRTKTRINSKNAEMILADDDIDLELKSISSLVALSNGSFCTAMSASKNAYIESKTYHLIIIEEAQDADNRVVRKSIHPMGASTNATIVKVGTANDKRSDFLEAIKRNRRRNLKGKRQYHFQYDFKVVQKYNPRYKAFIKKEKERLGENSDEFRMAYKCEFILERGMFLTEEKWNELIENSPKNLELVHSKREGTQVAGIDWAKKHDSTVVTVLDVDWEKPLEVDELSGVTHYRTQILDWLELTGDDYESQFYQVVDFLNKYNIRIIYSDSTGVGDGMVDRLKYYYEGIADVVGYVFSMPNKSTMYMYLNQELKANRLYIPNGSRAERYKKWQTFKQQMLELEKSWRGKYMVCHHPDEKGAKDDYCDSLALAMLASQTEGMPEIEVEENTFYDRVPRYSQKYLGRRKLFG